MYYIDTRETVPNHNELHYAHTLTSIVIRLMGKPAIKSKKMTHRKLAKLSPGICIHSTCAPLKYFMSDHLPYEDKTTKYQSKLKGIINNVTISSLALSSVSQFDHTQVTTKDSVYFALQCFFGAHKCSTLSLVLYIRKCLNPQR